MSDEDITNLVTSIPAGTVISIIGKSETFYYNEHGGESIPLSFKLYNPEQITAISNIIVDLSNLIQTVQSNNLSNERVNQIIQVIVNRGKLPEGEDNGSA